jgi:hypothetical protein
MHFSMASFCFLSLKNLHQQPILENPHSLPSSWRDSPDLTSVNVKCKITVLNILIVIILNFMWDDQKFCSDLWRAFVECNLIVTPSWPRFALFVLILNVILASILMVDFLFLFVNFLLDSDNDTANKQFYPFTSTTTHLLLANKVYVLLLYLCYSQTNYRQNKPEPYVYHSI